MEKTAMAWNLKIMDRDEGCTVECVEDSIKVKGLIFVGRINFLETNSTHLFERKLNSPKRL